jgi:PAS domain S-box-containing protein
VVWSAIWIVTSDYFVNAIAPNLSSWSLQTGKGLVYVAVSGLLLWLSVRAMEQAEAERRALNESKRRRLEESGLIGVAGRAPDGKIEYVNETFAQMLGYSYHELIGMEMSQLVPHAYAHLREQAEWHLRQFGRTALFELELARKDGSLMPILGGRATLASAHGEEIAYFVDITELRRSEEERKQLHEQLLQSEKINALGQLAAGAAHDFNNELAVIVGYASALHGRLSEDETSRGNTSQILKAADRAQILIGQLLAFSRKQPSNRGVIDLNHAVREMHSMLRPLLNENIEFQMIPSEQQECIEIDPTQLHQIMMNLVVNARDAMPNGGALTIAVSRSAMDGYSKELPGKSREFVMLRVTDTGKGIDDSIKLRIFEPFFTTKKQSGGTGLGLATVYGIVKQSNGDIEVTSKPGQGSSFTIKFPRAYDASNGR